MSKLSFRARALDPSKPLNIHIAEELPDLTEYSAINRAVPQMPSGMEKEEESEHHLQRAICTGLIIPTPEVFDIDQEFYDRLYPEDFKVSRQLIRMQPLGIEQDIPDYDMDSADEAWISSQNRRFDLSPLKFEEMMDRLEKSSGQTVVTLNEAKALLKQDDEISIAVYDYWLNKRLTTQHPLILTIKTENRAGSAVNNPYIAFRRRTEKMQTRKNRKNDETSYEKMLKLKRNLSRAVTLLEMIKRREKTKREHVHLGIEIFEKRYQAKDFNGYLLNEYTNNAVKNSRSAFAPLYGNQYSGQQSNQYWSNSGSHYGSSGNATGMSSLLNKHSSNDVDGTLHNNNRKEKRQYKKRKHKNQREKQVSGSTIDHLASSDEDEPIINLNNHLGHDTENEGLYPFRRSSSCQYNRPLINDHGHWPWETKSEHSAKYRFTLTSIRHPKVRCIGFSRRRRGRGGRIVLDRISTNMDEFWANLDYTIYSGNTKLTAKEICRQHELKKLQQQESLVNDKSQSIVIDLEPPANTPKSSGSSSSLFPAAASASSDDKMENIVIKTEEKTAATVMNECLDSVNRTKANNSAANQAATATAASIIGKHFDVKRNTDVNTATTTTLDAITNRNNGTVNIINTDNNNNSGNNSNNSSKNNSNSTSNTNNRLSNINNMFRLPSNANAADVRRHFNLAHSSPFGSSPSSSTSDNVVIVDASENTSTNLQQSNNSLSSKAFTNHISESANDLSTTLQTDDEKAVTNQLYSELFGDWLHFRPKTPDDELDVYGNFGEEFPQFTENASLSVDIQRITDSDGLTDQNTTGSAAAALSVPSDATTGKYSPKLIFDQTTDNTFKTNPFSYEYLQANTPKIETYPFDSTSSPRYDDESSADELNLSGDSLPGLTLSLGDNEANDKAIDTLLEECNVFDSVEDLKSINPNAFWNGLLDENGSLLDVIDSKKQSADGAATAAASTTNSTDRKPIRRRSYPNQRIGHSAFNVVNLHDDESVFVKGDPKDGTNAKPAGQASNSGANADNSNVGGDASTSVKKELDGIELVDTSAVPNNTMEIQIKDEPIDEINTLNVDEHSLHVRPIVPVIKTELGNNVPIVSNATIQRPITIQQTTHLQHQAPHQQTFATNDQTLILSSRPIRRLTTNGPADGKAGIQHLLINRKFQMITPRSMGLDDKEDVKPKIIEGAYLKLPPDFNVVSSNAMSSLNASNATSKHNYSLPPQAAFHQPITLIGQPQQSQNKVIINPSHLSTNLALATQSMSDKITIPTSNIKLNLVPSLAQVMQSGGGLVIDAKSGTVTGDMGQASQGGLEQTISGATSSTSSPNVSQIHYQQQQKMGQPMDRTRILYTNLKNNRASAQFLTQINPKVVNIVNIPHKGNAGGGGVQGLVNKTIQRVVVSSSQSQNQQLATAFRQSQMQSAANANSAQTSNALLGTNAAGNTVIITTSSASDGSSIIFNDMNTTSTIANSINTNNSNQTINLGNLTVTAASEKMNHNDGNATTINR
ncbi:uncharacterized protein LOC129573097 [Sitodiplosis mosellana]|uniref:uncharacterized protein LOC129573097 n=1 Tax=Sitodiplosis mosellana TaxID=263140 RepID=UPI002443A08B|nr:uncharacterized protein LOC129573097 [Sitodiplosis mosellana]